MRDDSSGAPNGRHTPAVNGVPTLGRAFSRVLPAGDDTDAPTDLVAVQVDDELVNAIGSRSGVPVLGGPGPVGPDTGPHGGDDRLVAMLAAWRAEIDAEPIPELVDLDDAVAAVLAGVAAHDTAARRKRAGRLRHLAPLAAAAAIIVATVGGVGLGSQDAMPGDTLWAVQKVVNPERAESVEAKVAVESHLEKVRAALEKGDTATAAQELAEIRTRIPAVRGQEGQPQLTQEQEFLAAKLADTPPGTPADLSTPARSNPAARPTSTAPAPPASNVPPAGPVVTKPSGSEAPTAPGSTPPDVRDRPPVDPAIAPEAPTDPRGAGEPVKPAPEKPEPQVTKEPEPTAPKPEPPVNTEGGSEVPTAPEPSKEPPKSGGDGGAAPGGDAGSTSASDTATASGSAGASVQTTATDSTTS